MEELLLHSNLLKEIQLRSDGDNHFGIYKGAVYKLGEITSKFIELLKIESISKALEEVVQAYDLTEDECVYLINSLKRLVESIEKPNSTRNYLKLSFTVFSSQVVNTITGKLTFFFKKGLVVFLGIMALAIHCYFFIKLSFNFSSGYSQLTYLDSFIIFTVVVFIALAHELGHSVASLYFGVPPKEIGFGFYIFFPVLFSNVTEIWVLDKFKRIWVNLAGLYFQIIISIPLLLLLIIFNQSSFAPLFQYLVLINIFMMAYSIIPFIRNDGYWVISDLVEISDLNKQANVIPVKVLMHRSLNNFNKWVVLYSFLSYFFIVYIALSLISGLVDNIRYILTLQKNGSLLLWLQAHIPQVFSTLISLFFITLLLRTFKNWIKLIIVELRS